MHGQDVELTSDQLQVSEKTLSGVAAVETLDIDTTTIGSTDSVSLEDNEDLNTNATGATTAAVETLDIDTTTIGSTDSVSLDDNEDLNTNALGP